MTEPATTPLHGLTDRRLAEIREIAGIDHTDGQYTQVVTRALRDTLAELDRHRTTRNPLAETLDGLTRAAAELLNRTADLQESRIACRGCVAEAHNALKAGTDPATIPPPNAANLIVDGQGQCYGHVQFTDIPLVPGQHPSGLFLPGGM